MPGTVPRTASQALSSAVLPYVVELIEKGAGDSGLKPALTVHDGAVVDPVLKQELGL
jgi:alanine dehydrogenase